MFEDLDFYIKELEQEKEKEKEEKSVRVFTSVDRRKTRVAQKARCNSSYVWIKKW